MRPHTQCTDGLQSSHRYNMWPQIDAPAAGEYLAQCGDRRCLRSWAFPLLQSSLTLVPLGGRASACLGGAVTQHYCPPTFYPAPACSDTFCPGQSSPSTCQLHLATQQMLYSDLEVGEEGGAWPGRLGPQASLRQSGEVPASSPTSWGL